MDKFPIVGVGGLVILDEKVLLVKRAKPPFKGLWTIPGGKVHWGETLQQALERELQEETGINVRAGEVIFAFDILGEPNDDTESLHVSQQTPHLVVIDLLAEYISGEATAGDDAAEARWFSVVELNQPARYPIQETTRTLLSRWGF